MEEQENLLGVTAGKRGFFYDLAEMVRETYASRELLYQMVLRDIRVRYKQAAMGFAWAIFMPIMIVASGFLVKYAMAHIAKQPPDMMGIAGMAMKAMVWAFFAGCVNFSSGTLTGNINLVTKIYFPREVLPMSAVCTQIFDVFIGSSVLAVFLFTFMGISLSWNVLWLIPLILMLICFTLALSLFISCANVFYRDVKYIIQVLITFGIFFSPVFYEPIMFGPTGAKIMMLNPLAPIMEGMRLSTVGLSQAEWESVGNAECRMQNAENVSEAGKSQAPRVGVNLLNTYRSADGTLIWSPWFLLYAAFWAFPGLLISWWNFHRLEFILAEYI